MMKMRKTATFLAASAMVFLLAGCGDGSEENFIEGPVELTAEDVRSDAEVAFMNLEYRYDSGQLTMDEYMELARMYEESGQIRRERDLLEQYYRLSGEEEAFLRLQEISVNLEEETGEIRVLADELLQNLELAEYFAEGIHTVSDRNWIARMMPKLCEGKRSYFLQKDGRIELLLEVGYTENGDPWAEVWYQDDAGQQTALEYRDRTLRVLLTEVSENIPSGSFEQWTLAESTGDVLCEKGSLIEGRCVGQYTAKLSVQNSSAAAFDLWNMRDNLLYTTYLGEFDEAGRTLIEQPDEKVIEHLLEGTEYDTCVVYAISEDGADCLYLGGTKTEEETGEGSLKDSVFEAAVLGIRQAPQISVYEVVRESGNGTVTDAMAQDGSETAQSVQDGIDPENGINPENDINPENSINPETGITVTQVRIYDGMIQLFNGKVWISVGSAQEYAKEDPFNSYSEYREALTLSADTSSGSWGEHGGEASGDDPEAGAGGAVVTTVLSNGRSSGSLAAASAAAEETKPSTGTSKPSTGTSKPSTGTTTKPSTGTTKPSTGTTTPSTGNNTGSSSSNNDNSNNDNNDNNNDNNDNNNSTPAPSQPESPTPTPPSTPSEPVTPPSDNGGNNGGGSSGGSSDSGNTGGSTDSGNSGGNSGGGDVDTAWGPDLLG